MLTVTKRGKVKEFKRFIQNWLGVRVYGATLIIAAASGLIVSASMGGMTEKLFQITEPLYSEIPVDTNISGWVSFDKESYLIGDIVRYRLRILWRNNVISPDLETLKNSVAFFPLSRRDVLEYKGEISSNVSEYELEFILQAVDVDPSTNYELPSPVVYYTFDQAGAQELQSFLIQAPPIHIGAFYPVDVSEIPLLDLRGEINDRVKIRQSLMLISAGLLLLLALILIRYFGQKRSMEKLTEPERIWREHHRGDRTNLDNRTYLLHCEHIFTRLLHYKTGISPMLFWSGTDPEDDEYWKIASSRIRELLIHSYLRSIPEDRDVEIMTLYLNEIFASLVEEEKLHREEEPSLLVRLKHQPHVIVACAILVVLSAIIFTTAMRPTQWASADIAAYNRIMQLVNDELTLHSGYAELKTIAVEAKDKRVMASALYNIGTLATNPRLSQMDPAVHEALLKVIFQDQKLYLDALLHAIEIDDEFQLIAILTETVRGLTQGEIAMKSAVRLSPGHVDIQRNLELLEKRRKAFAYTIRRLLQDENEGGTGELMRETLINIELMMEKEMPDEYSEMEHKGKDDKAYFIMERF